MPTSQRNSVLSSLNQSENHCAKLKRFLDENDAKAVENNLTPFIDALNSLTTNLEEINGRCTSLAKQLWFFKGELAKSSTTNLNEFSAALNKFQRQISHDKYSRSKSRKREQSSKNASRKKSNQQRSKSNKVGSKRKRKSKSRKQKFSPSKSQIAFKTESPMENQAESKTETTVNSIPRCSNSQIAIRIDAPSGNESASKTEPTISSVNQWSTSQNAIETESPLGNEAVSRTETTIGLPTTIKLDEIAIRTARPKTDSLDNSPTEICLDCFSSKKATSLSHTGSETEVVIRIYSAQTSAINDRAQRTPAPSARGVSRTEATINDDIGTEFPTTDVAIRTPPQLADGQNEISRTERTIGDDSDKPRKRKGSRRKKRSSSKKRSKRSKSKSKKPRPPSQPSDKAIRTDPKSELWALLSKTDKNIHTKSASERSVRSDRAIRMPPTDGMNLSLTEGDIKDYHDDKIKPSDMRRLYGTPNIQVSDYFNVRDVLSFKNVAIFAIVGIYTLIFVSQIWRLFNAVTSVYDVSVDDCQVASSLCHRYGMCCFNQCGNSRVQIFWSKLFS